MSNHPKKILIVVTEGVVGGAQMVVYNLACGLKGKGFDIAVGFGKGDFLAARLADAGIPVIRFKHLARLNNPLANIPFIFEMRGLIKKERYDAVQFNSTNSLFGALGAKWANRHVKTIFTVHGLSVLDKNYPAPSITRRMYRLFFSCFLTFVDVPVFVAQHDLMTARATNLTQRGVLIYNGVPTATLNFMEKEVARAAIEKKINRPINNAFIIGSIGRLSYQKNYGFLIESFNDMLAIQPNAVAVIMGDGPEHNVYRAKIKKYHLEDKIFLVGEIADAAHYLKAFDLFILPSRYEGLPLTLTECLFAAIPTLVSNVGGNSEITGPRSPYQMDNKTDFLEKFSAATKNLSGFLCEDAKKISFSLEKMIESYAALLTRS